MHQASSLDKENDKDPLNDSENKLVVRKEDKNEWVYSSQVRNRIKGSPGNNTVDSSNMGTDAF